MIHRSELPLRERRPLFNHEWQAVSFRTDALDVVFVDYCKYNTEHPVLRRGEEFLLSAVDFQHIYAPDLQIHFDGDKIKIEFENYGKYMNFADIATVSCSSRELIGGIPYLTIEDIQEAWLSVGSTRLVTEHGEETLTAAPEIVDGVYYLPVLGIMEKAFGADIQRFHEGDGPTYWAKPVVVRDTVSVSFDKSFHLNAGYAGMLTRALTKICGDIYGTYWFEEGNRLMPFRLYVPFTYRKEVPQKAVITFPGGLSNENMYYARIPEGGFQREAEKHGFMLIGLTGYGISTFFGSNIPILQTLDGIDYETADAENPENWPQETLDMRKLAEKGMWKALDVIYSQWNIDKNNQFVMGNSAGSDSAMYFFLKYPELFRAAVPAGGFINYHFADMSKIQPNTMFHVVGTEDEHGFNDVLRAYAELDRLGIVYKKRIVGGGSHAKAWTHVVDEIFDFLDEQVIERNR